MERSWTGACWIGACLALLLSWTLVGAQERSALADVSAVQGSSFGYLADNITLFGGAQPDTGPAPTVTLPAGGSTPPVTATAPTGLARYGPATLFSSGALALSTQGTTGPGGSVTTSSTITSVNTSGQEVFTAGSVASTCTASEAGTSGSTTITGGTLQTSENKGPGGTPVVVPVPVNPAPNTVITGAVETVGDTFRYVFNEQIVNPDGSLTINAAHQFLLGPTATGDLIIGHSVCGVTAAATTSTTTTTTSTSTSTSTSTTAGLTTTTVAPTTSTNAPGGVSGGAFGYFTSVGLFGGAPAARGPAPTVTLPSQGATPPLTATVASASAQYGPAVILESGRLDVSTEGTTSPRSVKSSSTVLKPGPPPFSADSAASTCTADETGVRGSTTIANGTLVTKTDADSNPVTTVPVPASPPPNTEIRGTLDQVGDSFRWVFNEQIVQADGSIIVNAAHQYLLGPVAVGEVIIGQSRCATTAAAFTSTASQAAGSAASTGAGGAGGNLARTGTTPVWRIAVGAALVAGGLIVTLLGRRRLVTGPDGG